MQFEQQEENTKLFGFRGVIGRRHFFLNEVIIFLITLPFILPYIVYVIFTLDYFSYSAIFIECPLILNICSLIALLVTTILNISNIWRRFKDIIMTDGLDEKSLREWCCLLYLSFIAAWAILWPFLIEEDFSIGICITILFPYIIIYLWLFFKEGESPFEESKISDRWIVVWILKERKKILSIYFIICAVMMMALFGIDEKPDYLPVNQDTEQINTDAPDNYVSPENRPIFTLEVKR